MCCLFLENKQDCVSPWAFSLLGSVLRILNQGSRSVQRGREGAVRTCGAEPRVLRWLETWSLQVLCVHHSPSSRVKIVEKSQLKKKFSSFKKEKNKKQEPLYNRRATPGNSGALGRSFILWTSVPSFVPKWGAKLDEPSIWTTWLWTVRVGCPADVFP